MRFRFADRKLESLYITGAGLNKFGANVISAFLRAMARIDAAVDERDLYRQKECDTKNSPGIALVNAPFGSTGSGD